MSTPATSMVRCDDGTEIPVEWVYADAEKCEWVWERAHWPDPVTPMELSLRQAKQSGADRAWTEAEVEPSPRFYRFQLAGPFAYVRANPFAPGRMAELSVVTRRLRSGTAASGDSGTATVSPEFGKRATSSRAPRPLLHSRLLPRLGGTDTSRRLPPLQCLETQRNG